MSDATRLLHGLRDYTTALDKHLALLRERRSRLEAAWFSARDVYHGEGADVFAEVFDRARSMVETYLATAEAVLPILRDRIESLGRFDSSNDPSVA